MSSAIRVCRRRELTQGRVRPVALGPDRRGRPREALILQDERGEVHAYLNLCQHLPIPLDAGSRRFLSDDERHLICGTHGALYRLRDGFCVHGPCAGQSLLALPVRVTEDGWVELAASELAAPTR